MGFGVTWAILEKFHSESVRVKKMLISFGLISGWFVIIERTSITLNGKARKIFIYFDNRNSVTEFLLQNNIYVFDCVESAAGGKQAHVAGAVWILVSG